MAIIQGVIQGTGQIVNIEVPTARIPELPEITAVSELVKLLCWDNVDNKTKGMTIPILRSKLIGEGAPTTPVVTNGVIQLTVDAAHADQLRWDIPTLGGKEIRVERRGIGELDSTEFSNLSTGGFLLTGTSGVMRLGEKFTVYVVGVEEGEEEVAANSGSPFVGIVSVTTSRAYVTTDANKIINFNTGSNKVTYTLPDIADVKENSWIPFETHINNQYQVTIGAAAGQLIYFKGNSLNQMYMGVGETLILFAGSDGWYVLDAYGNYSDVGLLVFGHKIKDNMLEANGALVRKDSYPRLWEYVSSLGLGLVTDADWTASLQYRGCFSQGETTGVNAGQTFRLPDLRGKYLSSFAGSSSLDTVTRTPNNRPGIYRPGGNKTETLVFPNTRLSTTDGGSGDAKLVTGGDTSPVGSFSIALPGQQTTTVDDYNMYFMILT